MLRDEAVTAGVAGPEVADDAVRRIGGRFRGNHRIRANRARGKIASARRGMRSQGRQDFSSCWHRDLLER